LTININSHNIAQPIFQEIIYYALLIKTKKMKKLFTFFILVFILGINANVFSQTYLSEDFEGAWTGDPAAPSGWSQSRITLLGLTTPAAPGVDGPHDWEQNTWTGTAWNKQNAQATVPTTGPQSGTGVLFINEYNFGSTTSTSYGTRRLESPVMNLSASTSPYARFYFYCGYTSDRLMLRIVASSNGGATWNSIMWVPPNANTTAFATTTPWQRVNVLIPAAYRTANSKIGFEMSNTWGVQNMWIDNLTVQEFTPTTITTTGTGNWSSTTPDAPWPSGVIPTSDNNVVIAAGHTVSADVGMARIQDMTVNGTFQYASTTTTLLCQISGNLTVNSGGTFLSGFTTTGKKTYLGGNLVCNAGGTLNFPGTTTGGALVWLGGSAQTFTNNGTLTGGRIPVLWHGNPAGVTYNSPLEVDGSIQLNLGTVNPNGNLTIGNSTVSTTITVERWFGNFSAAPLWGSGVTNSLTYYNIVLASGFTIAYPQVMINTGEEVENISGTRTVLGTLTMNTHNNVTLSTPVTVGNGTTGTLTLSRGIIVSTLTNLLSCNFPSATTGPVGIAPGITTPPITQGSFIAGPLKILAPVSGTTVKNFALGVGSSFLGSVPNSNILRSVVVNPGATGWTSQIMTASIQSAPTGSVNSPLTAIMGTRSYRINMNGGPDLPSTALLTLNAANYTFGNSDNLVGTQADLRIAQSTSLAGPWSERSSTTGTGSFVDNTTYSRTTAATAPGPIAPLATNGEYFAWATTAAVNDVSPFSISPSGSQYYSSGTTTIPMSGVVKNTGLAAVGSFQVTRRILDNTGTVIYTNSQTSPGLAVGATANITYANFTSFTSGNSYTIRDSTQLAGDGTPANDVLTASFTPNIAKAFAIYYRDIPSRDSLIAAIATDIRYVGQYDVIDAATYTGSFTAWRTVIALFTGSTNYTVAGRDSMISYLTGSVNGPTTKRSLITFGNDVGYYMDPARNTAAAVNDTILFRNYMKSKYITDSWYGTFSASGQKVKGLGAFASNQDSTGDPFPDMLTPVNGGSAAYIPLTESGDGDTCTGVSFVSNYNSFYFSTVFSNIRTTFSGTSPNSPATLFTTIANWITANNGALPVEMAAFNANVNKNDVNLNWTTVSEINNSGFDVERKLTSDNSWAKISHINGNGTTTSASNYNYTDSKVNSGHYNYRLKQMDFNGNFEYFNLSNEVIVGIPVKFDLSQNYPNPFNPTTKIDYALPLDGKVSMKLYDITGREVASLINNELMTAGYYTYSFSGVNLASGTYFYRLNVNGGNKSFTMTKKMMLVK
jgi:hypothetical protein